MSRPLRVGVDCQCHAIELEQFHMDDDMIIFCLVSTRDNRVSHWPMGLTGKQARKLRDGLTSRIRAMKRAEKRRHV